MLSLLTVLFALCAIVGEAFPSRYRRNYEASYHYIPFEEGLVRLPARYSPENYPNYHDYIHGYVHTHGHDWPVYYQPPVPSQSINNPYSNANEHHKMKEEHNWHFIDHNHVPITGYRDGNLPFESPIEAPNVIEALVKSEHIKAHGAEYDIPIVVEALTRKDYVNHEEIPIVDSLAIKEKPLTYEYNKNPVMTESLTNYGGAHAHKHEVGNSDSLSNKWEQSTSYNSHEPVKIGSVVVDGVFKIPVKVDSLAKKDAYELPVAIDYLDKKDKQVISEEISSHYIEKPIKEKPIKEKPIKEKPIKEKPIKEKPIKEKPIKEKPIKEKPIKEKPIATYEEFDYPVSLNEVVDDYESPVVVEALIRKEKPASQMEGEYETPVVIEALVRKHPPIHENKNKINPKDQFYPDNEQILTKDEIKKFDVVEALSLEQSSESNETPEQESFQFDEENDLKPEMDSFDESVELGSAEGFDGSDLSRSFLPVNSNIFSMVKDINEQERRKFKSCVTPKNETGNCMPFQLCSVSSTISNIDEFMRNVCILDEVFIGICCPEFPVETVRVDWEQLKPETDTANEEKTSQVSNECGKLSSMVTNQDPWPWMALLIGRSSNKIFCGAAVIADQYVLTAAHCTKRIPRNQILVRLGGSTSENAEPDFEVIEIKRHAGYNPRTMQNDIALLKLSRRIQFGDFRRTVCLTKDEESIEGLVSESASLLRWKETPGEIKDVESLSVISNQECQNRMRTAIADSIICTEPRTDETMCNADSGAPLIIEKDGKFEVIGILTWNRNDCDERFPTVFTRVSSYNRWIEKLAT